MVGRGGVLTSGANAAVADGHVSGGSQISSSSEVGERRGWCGKVELIDARLFIACRW